MEANQVLSTDSFSTHQFCKNVIEQTTSMKFDENKESYKGATTNQNQKKNMKKNKKKERKKKRKDRKKVTAI